MLFFMILSKNEMIFGGEREREREREREKLINKQWQLATLVATSSNLLYLVAKKNKIKHR